jgi:hypothetical protein
MLLSCQPVTCEDIHMLYMEAGGIEHVVDVLTCCSW